ncbi:HLA class II histocompatibility antigen, DM alpha chain-like isoform X2 [Protopterus annectens]|uniref:HLA class II histocompatibility antigen, DM alpha chain-like isoform X2 n=1 Tax=Protopterus annectens TaxID=7888 RepID=UPI001CFC3BAF|nr:HLA class II histocompatibility antigen, DM alpha chain-like isoform X2 [Protopterus annectens]
MEFKRQGQLWCFCLLVLLTARTNATSSHTYSQVFYCQKGEPPIAADVTFDWNEMLYFDFKEGAEKARIPDFETWAKEKSTAAHQNKTKRKERLCQELLQTVPIVIYNKTHLPAPEASELPVVSVYTMDSLEYGKANILICFLDNFFPPSVNITWYKNDTLITSGNSTTDAYPKSNFNFQMFGYLNFTPRLGDRYSCHIKHGSYAYPIIEYWVPESKPNSDILMFILCSLAFVVGLLGFIGGIVLLILGVKRRRRQDY